MVSSSSSGKIEHLKYINLMSKIVSLEKPGILDNRQSSVAPSMCFLPFLAKKKCKDNSARLQYKLITG